jgi:hypothetical protein
VEPIALTDLRIIERQLGRPPRGVVDVPVRCSYGYPQVLTVYPLVDGAPFPTSFWLSCPYLSLAVDRLEAAGWVSKLERRMVEERALRESMREAHERYVRARLSLLTAADRRALEHRGFAESLEKRGVGGIADRDRLKCLHLHVAHAMVDANAIGRIVLDRLGRRECLPENVICSAPEGTEQTL